MSARAVIEALPDAPTVSFLRWHTRVPRASLTHETIWDEIQSGFGLASGEDVRAFIAKNSNQKVRIDAGPNDTNEFTLGELLQWVNDYR